MTNDTPVIGIIGSGNIGAGVAAMASAAGLQVILSNSRGPSSLVDVVAGLGDHASADTAANAAARADIVVVAAPLAAYATLPLEDVDGTVVVDATNYYPQMTGEIAELEASGVTSSEFLQQRWPRARVVKTLNNVDFVRLPLLPRASGDSTRSALPVAGDHPEAKAAVVAFLDTIGFDSVDAGTLAQSWRFQPGTPLHVAPYSRYVSDSTDDPYQQFMQAEAVAVSREEAQQLLEAAAEDQP